MNKIFTLLCSLLAIGLGSMATAQESILDQVKSFTQNGDEKTQSAICNLLDELSAASSVVREGTDVDQRPVFVGAQADFERLFVHLLKTQQVSQLTCIIHTPAPATPLCIDTEITEGLVDPVILNDPKRLLTVKKRPHIIRDYLKAGGRLFTVFPKGGRGLRSPEQLTILNGLVSTYPDRLSAVELNCAEIPHDLIGATYFITLADSREFVLSFRTYQANRPTDDKWGIWFGPASNPTISDRSKSVLTFLNDNGFSLVKE